MPGTIKRYLESGNLPSDSDEIKLAKSTLLLMALPFGLIGLLWGAVYFFFGLPYSGIIPFSYGIASLTSILIFLNTKKYDFFRFSQILLILLLPFFLQLSLGGFSNSSTVIIWAIISPIGALVFYNPGVSLKWFFAYIALLVIALMADAKSFSLFGEKLSDEFIRGFFGMNIIGVSAMIFIIQYYFVVKQKELKKTIEQKNIEVMEKQKEILDSIHYAKRIQRALLASDNLLKNNLGEHFVFFKPKDIVSGDFYWAVEKDGRFYLAVCDSTGHGVPGAFMSLLNISFLNEAINERNIIQPNEIFNHVRQRLIENISSDGARDGMDAILICLDKNKNEISYAAAHNAPVQMRNGTLSELKADKLPVGLGEKKDSFTLHTIEFPTSPKESGVLRTDFRLPTTLFLYTDGFADQFGGPKGKKFKYKQLNEKLSAISSKSLPEQKQILEQSFDEWKGNLEQVDDVLVIGIRV